jgi:hypothetical protein
MESDSHAQPNGNALICRDEKVFRKAKIEAETEELAVRRRGRTMAHLLSISCCGKLWQEAHSQCNGPNYRTSRHLACSSLPCMNPKI